MLVKKHGHTDGLSRRPCMYCKHLDTRDVTEVSYQIEIQQLGKLICCMKMKLKIPFDTNWFYNKTAEEFKQAQLDDTIICKKMTWKKHQKN